MMIRSIYLLLLLSSALSLSAQETLFSQLKSDAYILANDELIHDAEGLQKFSASFEGVYSYSKAFEIAVNENLSYEMGEINTDTKVFSTMVIRSTSSSDKKQIEFLVIYEKQDTDRDLASLDSTRTQWMKLCNDHQAATLVSELYHKDAYYFNRGRLLKGAKAISSEYGYMNSPNYSLQLTPKKVIFVNPSIAFELGRCSGSYPLPYLLVWQKQADNWKILMDSNY